jgi:vitamin B12 transporter
MLIALLIAAASQAAPTDIVVTAARAPQEQEDVAASATVIGEEEIERLGDPLVPSLIRLTPSAAVETGGPAGTLSQVRIRGAEANHTLLFIDGIRANDPAAGDIPRFELLNADIVSRIEVVRGPQSALWGSDAIGGVIAVNGLPPERTAYSASAEAGSLDFGRAGASGALVTGMTNISGAVGWQRANGIDSFDGSGDGDGYRNLSARVRGSWAFSPDLEIGGAAFSLSGRSEFDGFNLSPPFEHMDTLDSTRNRLSAGRIWLNAGDASDGLSGTVSTSLLSSSNRNLLDDEEINRTRGTRWAASGQVQYRFSTGAVRHNAIVALDHDRETFRARDTLYFGATNQDRRRTHDAITAEWRAEIAPVIADIAVRHDSFSAFRDATTLRASLLARIGNGFSVAGSYSEGIAQPTFFDLYGFFPGSFAGNPSLKPESSRGFEISLRYRRGNVQAALTTYRQRLGDEIVDVFDPGTFQSSTRNRTAASRRSGVEAELGWAPSDKLHLTVNYAYLDASEPDEEFDRLLREIRRPKHSGSIAIDGVAGRFTYGGSLSFVGARTDTNFEVSPAQAVRLNAYWLAGARLGYRLRPALELFVRGSNLLDARYQDVFGYRTEGRAVFAGIRLGGP